jgi:hypothetical protein
VSAQRDPYERAWEVDDDAQRARRERIAARCALAALLTLMSCDLGDEAPRPTATQEVAVVASPAPAAATSPAPRGPHAPRLDRSTLPVKEAATLDRRAFLAAFERQAVATLRPCLAATTPAPASLAVSAVLGKDGRLRHVLPLAPAANLPDCARESLAAMRFESLGAALGRDEVTVQWRIDW